MKKTEKKQAPELLSTSRLLKALIIDDKSANVNTLHKLLELYCPQVRVCGTALNIIDGIDLIKKMHPDLLFLDIEMPDGSGFDLLRELGKTDLHVVFTTAYSEYAVRAFRENAVDYLLKPIDITALQEAVSKAEHRNSLTDPASILTHTLEYIQRPTTNKISIPVHNGYLFLDSQEIIRCEASGSYSNFHLNNGQKMLVSMNLKECEQILPAGSFFRVHHSHIVNLKYVVRYIRGRGGCVLMQDSTEVEVSANKKDEFLKIITR